MTLDTPSSFQYNLFLKLQFKKENIKNSINLSFYLARISAPVLLIVMSVPIKVLVNRKTSKIPHTIKNCFQRKRVLLSDRKVVHLIANIFPSHDSGFIWNQIIYISLILLLKKKMMKKLANTIYLESESTKPRVNLEIWKNGGFHDYVAWLNRFTRHFFQFLLLILNSSFQSQFQNVNSVRPLNQRCIELEKLIKNTSAKVFLR